MRRIAAIFSLLLFASADVARAQDADAPASAPPAAATAPSAAPAPAPLLDPGGPKIAIETSMGDLTIQLDPVHAPKTVANILRYVREGHYNGTVIYRVQAGFVIQMGSWDAKQRGRPVHAPVAFEPATSNLRGTVALAHADDPNSGTAEFFINLADNTPLDPNPANPGNSFAVFGQVVDGMDVADAISKVPVGDNGPMPGAAPVTPILIKKISLLK